MSRTTFRQPLPSALRPYMSQGYMSAHAEPLGFELISVPPAGSLSLTGSDAARFMISLLDDGAGLLRPDTAALMVSPTTTGVSGLNRMALGFYEQRVNDVVAISHGGDLSTFHTYLWTIPEHDVGVFVSMNSSGVGVAPYRLRRALFEQFVDRYYPVADVSGPKELPTAREHAGLLAGSYLPSRTVFSNFLAFGNFVGQTRIGLDAHGRPLVPDLYDGPSRTWIEVEPFVWRDATGHGRLAAEVKDGRVIRWSVDDVSPFQVFLPTPWHQDAAWLLPLFMAAFGVIAITALAWPLGAAIRRYYRAESRATGARSTAGRLTTALCWLALAAMGGWLLVFDALGHGLGDAAIWAVEIASVIGFLGLFAASLWHTLLSWRDEGPWVSKVWSSLLFASASVVLYVAVVFNLIHLGAKY